MRQLTKSGMSSCRRLGLIYAAMLALATPVAAMEANTPYEVEAGFADYPLHGPPDAVGLVIWNHGAMGNEPAYTFPPPFALKALAAQGWDVMKIDRNPRFEAGGWAVGGQRHVAGVLAEIDASEKLGYRRIIVAGQSYGGGIALEAAARRPVYGVIAMAPGTGQTVLRDGTPYMNHTAEIERNTYDQVEHTQASRALFAMPADDEWLPGADRAPRVREIMTERGLPFIVIDRQIHGHTGALGAGFFPFAACGLWFMNPSARLRPGEFHCYRDELPMAAAAMGISLAGATRTWFGYLDGTAQSLVVVERQSDAGSLVDIGMTGPLSQASPSVRHGVPAAWRDGVLSFRVGPGRTVSVRSDSTAAEWTLVDDDGTKEWRGKLTQVAAP